MDFKGDSKLSGPLTWLIKLDGKTVIWHADHIRNSYVQCTMYIAMYNDKNVQEFEKNEIKGTL